MGGAATQLDCYISATDGTLQLRSIQNIGTKVGSINFSASHSTLKDFSTMPSCGSRRYRSASLQLLFATTSRVVERVSAHGVRCTATVSLHLRNRGSGWVAHPAVIDNALQLGPATGDVGKEDDANVTRVVAGMAAYANVKEV